VAVVTRDAAPRVHWLVRRLLASLAVLFVVSLVVFAATQALPSDPAEAILGRDATPERVAALRDQLNLDRSLPSQYVSWLGGILQGDLGESLTRRAPFADALVSRFSNSFVLFAVASLIAVPLSLVFGVLGATRRDSWGDRVGVTVSLLLSAVPEFVIGVLLTLLLATTVFHIFTPVALVPEGESILKHPEAMALPVLTLVLAVVPYLNRLVRAAMTDTLGADYVQMARLKGISESQIARRHALPNTLIPVVQASALVMAYLFSGVLVVEFLFRYPGLGTMLADAVANRDLPVIQAVTLVYAASIVLLNLSADVLTIWLSPRLRTGDVR